MKVNGKADTALADQYGIAGYPTVILTQPDGTEIDRMYGYYPPEEFLPMLQDYLADRNTLADYLRRADTAATMEVYNTIGNKYTSRKMFTEAETYYRKILQQDPTNKLGYSDSAMYNIGEMKIRAKQFAAAQETFDRLRKTYPESPLFDDALYEKAIAMRRADQFDDAIAGFKEFLSAHPESDLVPDAKIYVAYCSALKGDTATALEWYRRFLDEYPESSEIDWIRGQIEKLENPPAEEESN
ncbi:MAG: tetratricopeptide repeat protein [Candidatus Zixiibacteriota bacterium]